MPRDDEILISEGLTLRSQGKTKEAIAKFERVLHGDPQQEDALYHLGVTQILTRDFQAAVKTFSLLVGTAPQDSMAWSNLGYSLIQTGDTDDALEPCLRAINITPNNHHAWNNLGTAQQLLGLFDEAQQSFNKAVDLEGNNPLYLYNLGTVLYSQKNFESAVVFFRKCLTLEPKFALGLNNLGASLLKIKEPEEAIEVLTNALAINPRFVDALKNLGNAYVEVNELTKALEAFQNAASIEAKTPDIWLSIGRVQKNLRQFSSAIESFDHATNLDPNFFEALLQKGLCLLEIDEIEPAIACFENALSINKDHTFLKGLILHNKMKLMDWLDYDNNIRDIESGLSENVYVANPLQVLGLIDSPDLQRVCAELYTRRIHSGETYNLFLRNNPRKKIRLAYFSPDFGEHPVSYLMEDVFGLHDREKFEVIGISIGHQPNSGYSKKIRSRFEKFFDFSEFSDQKLLSACRSLQLDIAIDLGGFTANTRPKIIIERMAPVQINYLGYPGTFGHPSMDYIIGDNILIPKEGRSGITEKVIFMPYQFQANPLERLVSEPTKREDHFLPKDAFVFCAFNNSWKVSPYIFECWMGIMRQVPKAVLWLYLDHEVGRKNLRNRFRLCGVDPDRIIFAGRAPRQTYQERLSHADLFLDTYPYNAGTTASDSIWAGVPVLTLCGKSIASRMAASLLSFSGLEELVVHSREDYVRLAVTLANSQEAIQKIKFRLVESRPVNPLFRTEMFTKDLEKGLQLVFKDYIDGVGPRDTYVESI